MSPATKKELILTAASRFFSEKGFWDTHMNEIARTAGVADGTIFYHFKTKEDLFLAVLRQFKNELLAGFEDYLATTTFANGLAKAEGLVSFYLAQSRKMEESFLLLHRHHYYQLAKENPECWDLLEDIYHYLIGVFEQAVLAGQQDGSVRDSSSTKTALLLFTLVDGLVRLETYNLYRFGTLHEELVESCRLILKNN